MTEQTFAERLLAHRSLLGLSQDEVGKILGVTSQTISNWEGGTVPRKARMAQVEVWLTSGQVPSVEPVVFEPKTPKEDDAIAQRIRDLRNRTMELSREHHLQLRREKELERHQLAEVERASFVSDLPDGLKVFSNPPAVPYKHLKFGRDYLSSEVCATMVFPQSVNTRLEPAVMKMLALKALDTEAKEARMFYALIVVGADSGTQARETSLITVAALLGVGMFFVPDASAAAAEVVALESVAMLL